jgi:hypothetical protein
MNHLINILLINFIIIQKRNNYTQSQLPIDVLTHPMGHLDKNPKEIICNNVIKYIKPIYGIIHNNKLNIVNVIGTPIK